MKMGIDRISVRSWRSLVVAIRICYRCICKHPFLLGFVFHLLIMYRFFPALFSVLVSVSPVLVCTALLLALLLSYGEPNIPEPSIREMEITKDKDNVGEDEVRHHVSSITNGVTGDGSLVIKRSVSFDIGRLVRRRNTGEEDGKECCSTEKKVDGSEVNDGLDDCVQRMDESSRDVQLKDEHSRDLQPQSTMTEESGKEFVDLAAANRNENEEEESGGEEELGNDKSVESQYTLLQNMEDEDEKAAGEIRDALLGDVERKKKEDDDASSSGSDGGESSSPDASMTDVTPMLDELHPLLDDETPETAHISRVGSDAGSEESGETEESKTDSDEDLENQAEEEENGDDDNDPEEEETDGGKEDDDGNTPIKWTEDDQRNLIDLGTSELERNQRLESLIARRMARGVVRTIPEKNLIDLDDDIPHNIQPISTARRNPFDLPYDDGPGSAPSIMQPRINPFDSPYDLNEEKFDHHDDSSQQGFTASQHREQVFRRHESFSVGPSVLGFSKHDRHDVRWKPIFVPEQSADEGTSFQRQLSGASESKMSSVPDTESVGSPVDEEKRLEEEVDFRATEMISSVDQVSVQRGSFTSEDVESVDIGQADMGHIHHDEVEISLGEPDYHHEADSSLTGSGEATPVEIDTSEILLRMEPSEDYSSRSSISSLSEVEENISDLKGMEAGSREESYRSTRSSLDEEFQLPNAADGSNQHESSSEPQGDNDQQGDPVSDLKGDETGDHGSVEKISTKTKSLNVTGGVVDNDPCKEPVTELGTNDTRDSRMRTHTSIESDSNISPVSVDYHQQEEPVYDASPRSAVINFHFGSFSSDTHDGIAESLPGESEGFSKINSADEHEVKIAEHQETTHSAEPESKVEGLKNKPTKIKKTVSFVERSTHDESVRKRAASGDALHKDEDLKLSSSRAVKLERQPSLSDMYLVPSVSGPESEPSTPWKDFPEVVSNDSDGNALHESDGDDALLRAIMSLKPDATPYSLSPDSVEYKTPGVDFRNEFFDKIANIDDDLGSEDDDLGSEDDDHSSEHNSNEEDDAMKEIAETLLFELDTVGDFSISDNVDDPLQDEQMKLSSMVQHQQPMLNAEGSGQNTSGMEVVDAKSLEEIHTVVKHVSESNTNDLPQKLDSMSEPLKLNREASKAELPILEVRTAEDIDMAFKQLDEGADVEEVILPSSIQQQESLQNAEGSSVGSSDMEVVEAKSLEDIYTAIEQLPQKLDSIADLLKSDEETSSMDLPVLDVKTVNDIEIAFKQLHEGVSVDEVILPSMIQRQRLADELKGPGNANLGLTVVEASSLDDISTAITEIAEGDISKASESPVDGSNETHCHELNMMKEATIST